MANIITGLRILLCIPLMFLTVRSGGFYIIYLLAGLTDMIDGTVARKTNTQSEFGAVFDTVADFVFFITVLIKFLPILHIPHWLWIWIIIIAIIRVADYIPIIMRKKFTASHTTADRITGILLFVLPFSLHFADVSFSITAVCAMATFSVISQTYSIIKGNQTERL